MSPSLFLRLLARDSRGSRGRLAFFVVCLAVGVAAVVAVASLAASLEARVRAEARPLLAADLVIEGRGPLPESLRQRLDTLVPDPTTLRRTELLELVSVVAASPAADGTPGKSQLAELKVIQPGYPFYGTVETEPAEDLTTLLSRGAVVGPELLPRLGLAVGDELKVGTVRVPIVGVVRNEPDRVGSAFGFAVGPRVMIAREVFDRAGLGGVGSRIEYRTLVALPPGASEEAARQAKVALRAVLDASPQAGNWRIETWAEAQPALRRGITQVGRFLGLVALLSLMVGGIGVGQTVRAWLAGRLDAIAVLKCLGMRPREVFALYLGQTALLALLGSVAGALVGVGLQFVLPQVLGELLPANLIDPWQPRAILRGLSLGIGVAVLFALPPLAGVLRVSPARVLRRTAEPLPAPRWIRFAAGLVVLAGVWALASAQSGSLLLGAQFTAAAGLAAALLTAGAWALARAAGRWRGGRFWLRYGLASLARPGAGTLAGIVSLGLGVLVVLGMWLVERGLTAELRADLPTAAPSVFLVDIQPGQWAGIQETLTAAGASHLDSVPLVMARLSAIDGKTARELAPRRPAEGADPGAPPANQREGSRRWALTREQRLTYLEKLPPGNELVSGELWSVPNVAEISVEEDFARDLGVVLGSTLRFDIQGVPLDLKVTSLRKVDWATFGINFFFVVEPGVLDDAPQQRVASARLPAGREDAVQDQLAASFPNVTMLRIREILDKVISVLDRISLGIRVLGSFTVFAGIAILAGAVAATASRRGREVALLKTLGGTRATVAATFAVEYALVGLLAGTVGTAGGAVLAWRVLTGGMEVTWRFEPFPLAIALGTTLLLAVTAGLLASSRALTRRPIEVLREG